MPVASPKRALSALEELYLSEQRTGDRRDQVCKVGGSKRLRDLAAEGADLADEGAGVADEGADVAAEGADVAAGGGGDGSGGDGGAGARECAARSEPSAAKATKAQKTNAAAKPNKAAAGPAEPSTSSAAASSSSSSTAASTRPGSDPACRPDPAACPWGMASRLNSMKDRPDLWGGEQSVAGWVARQGTVPGLTLVDFNYPQVLATPTSWPALSREPHVAPNVAFDANLEAPRGCSLFFFVNTAFHLSALAPRRRPRRPLGPPHRGPSRGSPGACGPGPGRRLPPLPAAAVSRRRAHCAGPESARGCGGAHDRSWPRRSSSRRQRARDLVGFRRLRLPFAGGKPKLLKSNARMLPKALRKHSVW